MADKKKKKNPGVWNGHGASPVELYLNGGASDDAVQSLGTQVAKQNNSYNRYKTLPFMPDALFDRAPAVGGGIGAVEHAVNLLSNGLVPAGEAIGNALTGSGVLPKVGNAIGMSSAVANQALDRVLGLHPQADYSRQLADAAAYSTGNTGADAAIRAVSDMLGASAPYIMAGDIAHGLGQGALQAAPGLAALSKAPAWARGLAGGLAQSAVLDASRELGGGEVDNKQRLQDYLFGAGSGAAGALGRSAVVRGLLKGKAKAAGMDVEQFMNFLKANPAAEAQAWDAIYKSPLYRTMVEAGGGVGAGAGGTAAALPAMDEKERNPGEIAKSAGTMALQNAILSLMGKAPGKLSVEDFREANPRPEPAPKQIATEVGGVPAPLQAKAPVRPTAPPAQATVVPPTHTAQDQGPTYDELDLDPAEATTIPVDKLKEAIDLLTQGGVEVAEKPAPKWMPRTHSGKGPRYEPGTHISVKDLAAAIQAVSEPKPIATTDQKDSGRDIWEPVFPKATRTNPGQGEAITPPEVQSHAPEVQTAPEAPKTVTEPLMLYRGEMAPPIDSESIGKSKNIAAGSKAGLEKALPITQAQNRYNLLSEKIKTNQDLIQRLRDENESLRATPSSSPEWYQATSKIQNNKFAIKQAEMTVSDYSDQLKKAQEELELEEISRNNSDLVYLTSKRETADHYARQRERQEAAAKETNTDPDILYGPRPAGYNPTIHTMEAKFGKVYDITGYGDPEGAHYTSKEVKSILGNLGVPQDDIDGVIERSADEDGNVVKWALNRGKNLSVFRKALEDNGYDAVHFLEGKGDAAQDNWIALKRDGVKLVSSEPLTSQEAPKNTPEYINQARWYHGTKGSINSEKDIDLVQFSDSAGLFGPGFYMTDDPSVAGSYAKNKGKGTEQNTYTAKLNVGKVIDMEAPAHPDYVSALKEGAYDQFKADIDEAAKKPGATNQSVYKALQEAVAYESQNDGVPKYEYDEMYDSIRGNLVDKGYDALTHTGGLRVGDKQHRVTILLDPTSQVSNTGRNPIAEWGKHDPTQPTAPDAPQQAIEPPKVQLPTEGAKPVLEPPTRSERVSPNSPVLKLNQERNGVELRFSAPPGEAITAELKAGGFRYSKPQRMWYAKQSDNTLSLAQRLAGSAPEAAPEAPAPVDTKAPEIQVPEPQAPSKNGLSILLRKQAESLNPKIETKRNPGVANQNPTARRARMADASYAEADRLEGHQRILHALADAHESGTVPDILKGITSRPQIEELQRSKMPDKGVSVHYLRDIVEAADGTKGTAAYIKTVRKAINRGAEDSYVRYLDPQEISAAKALAKTVETKVPGPVKWFRETLAHAERLEKAGIDTPEKWEQARKALADLDKPAPKVSDTERTIKQKERELIGAKIPGYFPTPKPLVDRMLEKADIQPGDTVLEPSAGKGNIADAIREKQPQAAVKVVETAPALRDVLQLKGHDIVGDDFLQTNGFYKKIVMNPPFENGQDIDHVRHAYDRLEPGGKLVAIMSEGPFFRSDRKAREFREWMTAVGGESEKNPDGSFKASDVSTGVNTRMVEIMKPRDWTEQAQTERDIKSLDERATNSAKHEDAGWALVPGLERAWAQQVGVNDNLIRMGPASNKARFTADRDSAITKYADEGKFIDLSKLSDDDLMDYQTRTQAAMKGRKQDAVRAANEKFMGLLTAEREKRGLSGKSGTMGYLGPTGDPDVDTSVAKPGEPVSRVTIVQELQKILPVYRKRLSTNRRAGEFLVRQDAIRMKNMEDMQTMAHELGHHLSFSKGLDYAGYEKELRPLGASLYPNYAKSQQHEEGVAEAVRLWFTDPAKAKQVAPGFTSYLESHIDTLDDEARKHVKTMRALYDNYRGQDDLAKARGRIENDQIVDDDKWLTWKEEQHKRWLDDTYDIYKFMGEMYDKPIKSEYDVPEDLNVYVKARLHQAWPRKAAAMIFDKSMGPDGKVTGEALQKILDPIIRADKLKDFRTYATMRRVEDLDRRGIPHGFEDINWRGVKDQLETPEFKDAADKLHRWSDNLLNWEVHYGVLSKEAADEIRKENEFYLPMYRVYEGKGLTSGKQGPGLSVNGVTKKVRRAEDMGKGETKGSIIDPFQSLVRNAFNVMEAVSKQDVANSMAKLYDQSKGKGGLMVEVPAPVESQRTPLEWFRGELEKQGVDTDQLDMGAVLTRYRAQGYPSPAEIRDRVIMARDETGKKRWFQLHPAVYNAFTKMGPQDPGGFMRLLGVANNYLRMGITTDPEYGINNFIRDTGDRTAYTKGKGGGNPIRILRTTLKGLGHVMKKTDLYTEADLNGAFQATVAAWDRRYYKEHAEKVFAKPKDRINLIHTFLRWQESIEESNRMGEYMDAKEAGLSPKMAGFAARDLMDFQKQGTYMRQWNKVSLFANAGVQGVYNFTRLAKRNPSRFAFIASLMAVYAMAEWFHNKTKDQEKWLNEPAYRRDHGITLYLGDKTFYQPLPQEWGFLKGAMQRVLDTVQERDPKHVEEIGRSFADTFTPRLWPTVGLALIENLTNYDTFTGAPIENMGDKYKVGPDRYSPRTHESSKVVANAVYKATGGKKQLSPKKIDNLVKDTFGTLGTTAQSVADVAVTAAGANNRKLHLRATDVLTPLKGLGDGGSFPSSPARVNEFYDEWERLQAAHGSEKKFGRRMNLEDSAKYGRMKHASKSLSRMSKAIQVYEQQGNKQLVDATRRQMAKIAAAALGKR